MIDDGLVHVQLQQAAHATRGKFGQTRFKVVVGRAVAIQKIRGDGEVLSVPGFRIHQAQVARHAHGIRIAVALAHELHEQDLVAGASEGFGDGLDASGIEAPDLLALRAEVIALVNAD